MLVAVNGTVSLAMESTMMEVYQMYVIFDASADVRKSIMIGLYSHRKCSTLKQKQWHRNKAYINSWNGSKECMSGKQAESGK